MIPMIVTYDLKVETDGLGSSHDAFRQAALEAGWLKKVHVIDSIPCELPNTTFWLQILNTQDGHNQFHSVLRRAEQIRGGKIVVLSYIMTPLFEGSPVFENFVEKISSFGRRLGIPDRS